MATTVGMTNADRFHPQEVTDVPLGELSRPRERENLHEPAERLDSDREQRADAFAGLDTQATHLEAQRSAAEAKCAGRPPSTT